MVLGNLAVLALDREQWAEAESLARKALVLAEKIGRQELIASDCHHLAQALLKQNPVGADGRAKPPLQEALSLSPAPSRFSRACVIPDCSQRRKRWRRLKEPSTNEATNSRIGAWHSSIRVKFVDGLPQAQETLVEIKRAMLKSE